MRIDNNKRIKFNNNTNWIDKELTLPRAKRTIKALVQMMLQGNIDYKILGNLYRPDQKIPEATVKRFLKHTNTKKMIDKELEIALSTEGITRDYLIKNRKFIIEQSKDNDRLETMLKALSGFETMLGMDKANTQKTLTTQEVSYKQLLNGETNELKLSQTTEEPIDTTKDDK